MNQNIYDDPDFFAGYSRLARSRLGLAGAPEWPSLRTMVGDVSGRRVVDLGCGYGWFCRWAAAEGAAAVLGIDVSARMLARAAEEPHERITYRREDLEAFELPAASFDLAYSSLTLHYLVGLDRMLGVVRRALVDGGLFVCSVEHPTITAPSRPGFVELPDGRTVWPLDDYLVEGPRVTDWLAEGVVKQHRTIGTYVDLLGAAGFSLTRLVEWGPNEQDLAAHPEWAAEVRRPAFLLLAANAV